MVFRITATVRRRTGARGGDVVVLRLRWSYWCSSMCAMYFTQTRTVSFDRTGAVVSVAGDERFDVIVS